MAGSKALQVCSRQGAIQIHVYLYLYKALMLSVLHLSTSVSCDAIFLRLLEEFQWNLAQMFTVWVGSIAEKVFKVRLYRSKSWQGQMHFSGWEIPIDLWLLFCRLFVVHFTLFFGFYSVWLVRVNTRVVWCKTRLKMLAAKVVYIHLFLFVRNQKYFLLWY